MTCIYNKIMMLQVVNYRGSIEDKHLNLIMISAEDALTIKIRDPSEYTFNYSENIDLGDYEVMRVKQNLEINFTEFKSNLLEMLDQLQNREMFLRCELSDQLCTLVFFNKSKIKSIVHLTVELHAASQKEIINEMMNNLQHVKDSNERLQIQLSSMRKGIIDKDKEIKQLNFIKNEMERHFYSIIKEVEDNINMKSREIERVLLRRMTAVTQRIIKVLDDANNLRRYITLKSDSNVTLLKSIEDLRLENNEKSTSMEHLTKENKALQAVKLSLEKNLTSLRNILNEREIANKGLQSKNEELRVDMEKATVIIAQKRNTVDELKRDLVQANEMLINFNRNYDVKVEAFENLQSILTSKNEIIEEEKAKNCQLRKQFGDYRRAFNEENQEKIKHDLIMAQNKIDELEQAIRKTNKINALLSEKVNKITR